MTTIAAANPYGCPHREPRKFPGGGRFSAALFCPACGSTDLILLRRRWERRRITRGSPQLEYECRNCSTPLIADALDNYCGEGCPWWYVAILYLKEAEV